MQLPAPEWLPTQVIGHWVRHGTQLRSTQAWFQREVRVAQAAWQAWAVDRMKARGLALARAEGGEAGRELGSLLGGMGCLLGKLKT